MNEQTIDLVDRAGKLAKGFLATGFAGVTLSGVLSVVLTVVSIAVGLAAFYNYMLCIKLNKLQLTDKEREKKRETNLKEVV